MVQELKAFEQDDTSSFFEHDPNTTDRRHESIHYQSPGQQDEINSDYVDRRYTSP